MKSIDTAKYRKIFETPRKELRDGLYPSGVPLPSEESLIRKYNVSRITAVRAMDELVKCGLVYRKRGAGTFATRAARLSVVQFGTEAASAVGESEAATAPRSVTVQPASASAASASALSR